MMNKRINILYLCATTEIGGAEQVLLNIVEGLDKEIYVPILITQGDGSLAKRFGLLGGKVFFLKMPAWRKGKNFLFRYFFAFKAAQIAKREGVDLIHCNFYRLNPYARLISKLNKIPFVVHIHDFLEKKHIDGFELQKIHYLITTSDFIKDCFKAIQAKVFRVHNSVDIRRFEQVSRGSIRKEFQIDEDTLLVGMISYFMPRKRHDLFIEISSLIKKKMKDVKFLVVGDNLWESSITMETLKNSAKQKGLDNNDILFVGRRNDVEAILKDLDIFIFPSEKEPFGLVVLEAMASRVLTAIGCLAGGPCEIVEDKKDGLILDFKDMNSSSDQIVSALHNQNLRSSLVEAGYQKVKNSFNQKVFVRNIENVYIKILEESRL